MWLPVEYTFSKNKTLAAINSGKYGNIRGMFAPSADTQTSGGSWSTAAQAATKPGSSKTVVNALFDMGATCWYFVQELVDRGVTTPIGIADTAIGGQRIEEFMNNASFADAIPCPDELGGKEVRLDNSQHDGCLVHPASVHSGSVASLYHFLADVCNIDDSSHSYRCAPRGMDSSSPSR